MSKKTKKNNQNVKEGRIGISREKELYFNKEKPLCECGSHELYYHKYSVILEKDYQCVSCHAFVVIPKNEKVSIKEAFRERYELFEGIEISKDILEEKLKNEIEDFIIHAKYIEGLQETQEMGLWVSKQMNALLPLVELLIRPSEKQVRVMGVNITDIAIEPYYHYHNIDYKLCFIVAEVIEEKKSFHDIIKQAIEYLENQ